ncbi:BQ2448_7803 [Microbotryum intermedium]|uniref:BQ2448_7803 protein n=1 Tax=Microbotryum intermedium TaxID=269621 RepID=A0A238FSE2_9BASI|nr:BQ2448_7803 [Microbotryum intermedium]
MTSKLLGARGFFFALSRAHAGPLDLRRLTTGPSSNEESEAEPSRSSAFVCFDGRRKVATTSAKLEESDGGDGRFVLEAGGLSD